MGRNPPASPIMATTAKTRLLQDVNLIDRTIGTLFIDDGQRADRIPSRLELQKPFDSVVVTDAELICEAELARNTATRLRLNRQREMRETPRGNRSEQSPLAVNL